MSLPLSDILEHLELEDQPPSLDFLNEIAVHWASRIPWESAARIARHQLAGEPVHYARPAGDFFRDALALGTGGTCFESNFALHALLVELDFDASLSFCDMEPTINPHCAVGVWLDDQLYMVDVGYPVPVAYPLKEKATTVNTGVYQWTAEPSKGGKWRVTYQSGEREGYSFTFKDTPIERNDFFKRLVKDHDQNGYFLDEVIISKTYPDRQLRFSDDKGLIERRWGVEEIVKLSEEESADLPTTLSELFGMSREVIRAALTRTAPVGVPDWVAVGEASLAPTKRT